MKSKLLPAVMAAALLSSCAGGWQPEDRAAFLQACREGVGSRFDPGGEADRYCECRLMKTMEHYKTIPEVVVNRDSAALNRDLQECEAGAGR